MSNDVNVNKVDEKHKKQAEHLADKYEKQGWGTTRPRTRRCMTSPPR